MEFHLIKHNGVFKAADYDSEDAVKKIGEGEVVKAKSMSQRNYGHHKKFFVLMRFGFHHKPEWMDEYFSNSKRGKENFRKEVIKAAGYYHYEYDFNGNKKKVADSIAFDNMDQDVFDDLYSDCIDIFCRMLNTDKPELMEQLMTFT